MINRKDLRERIPHGGCQKIAELAGVGVVAVSNYFSGNSNSQKVEHAALRYLAQLNKEKKQLVKAAYE